jgi:hypothetical protein
MTVAERTALLEASIAVVLGDPRSRRFALRRSERGLEIFDIKHTGEVDGEPEFHGHPASRVDRAVLKVWRDRGEITLAEYNRLRRELPGC